VRAGAFAQSNGLKWENVPGPHVGPVRAYPRFRTHKLGQSGRRTVRF